MSSGNSLRSDDVCMWIYYHLHAIYPFAQRQSTHSSPHFFLLFSSYHTIIKLVIAMFQTVNLTPSPVSAAFSGIQWDPLEKIGLTDTEKSLLRSGEDNPVDYTLSTHEDACMYVRALLKVLAESVGPNG